MKVVHLDGGPERAVVTGMVLDGSVLGAVSQKWEANVFASRWANLVGGWCVTYYRRYGKPPGKAVEGLYDEWAAGTKDNDTAEAVARFLGFLSDEAKGPTVNAGYVLDQAAKVFNRVKVKRLIDELEMDLDANDTAGATTRIEGFHKVAVGAGAGIDPFGDEEAVRRAFEARSEPLITYPGALGNFFGDALERDGLIAFEGPEKRGKSFVLMDIVWQAVKQNRRVAYFQVGDMSQNQVMLRLMARAARHPVKAGTVKYPTRIDPPIGNNHAEVSHDVRHYGEGLSWQKAWRKCQAITAGRDPKNPLLKLSTHPSDSISVRGIEGILAGWGRDGFVPDCVVIDYADILAPINPKEDGREQINTTWKAMASLRQSLHCLVVTATQTDAASYTAHTIGKGNFSGDKRKNAHVTGMVGLNATDPEKAAGILRLNWVALREGEFDEKRCVHVAGCLPLAAPFLRSTF